MSEPIDSIKPAVLSIKSLQMSSDIRSLEKRFKGGAAKIANPQTKSSSDHLDRACAEIESLFLHQLLRQMRASIPKSQFMEKGQAEKVYYDLLDGEMAKRISVSGGIGLAQILKSQLQLQLEKNDSDK